MAKTYTVIFGSGDPRTNTGLSPTFLIFQTIGGTGLIPPGISETAAGTGFYTFSYGMTTFGLTTTVQFLIDGGAGLSSSDRYISDAIDPLSFAEQSIGWTIDSFGTTLTDPASLFGQAKRNQEFNEGNATYNKTTTKWDIFSRGSSTLLTEKTLTNTSSSATKT